MAIDYSSIVSTSTDWNVKTYLTIDIYLDREFILNTLATDSIYIYGKYYKIPERLLCEILLNKRFGLQEITLEQIDGEVNL